MWRNFNLFLMAFSLVGTGFLSADSSEMKPIRFMDAHFTVNRSSWDKPLNEGSQVSSVHKETVCEGDISVPVYDMKLAGSMKDRSYFGVGVSCEVPFRKSWNEDRSAAYFSISADALLTDEGAKSLRSSFWVSDEQNADKEIEKVLGDIHNAANSIVVLDDVNASGVTLFNYLRGSDAYRMAGGDMLSLTTKFQEKDRE